jgi:hypothetical protein
LAPTTLHGYERHALVAIHHIGRISLEKLKPLDLDRLYAKLLEEGGRPEPTASLPAPSPG